MTRFGTVALVGSPNAGKSTLLNNLIGEKISIVSPKVQTTRSVIRGIAISKDTQIVFFDTPGLFKPFRKLEKSIVKAAWHGLHEADYILMLFDSIKGITDNDIIIIKNLQNQGIPCSAVLNKVDKVDKPKLLELTNKLAHYSLFEEIFMISALTGEKVKELSEILFDKMPEGEWHFSEDEITDAPSKFLAQEFTREQVFLKLHKEIPYNVAVETEAWEEQPDGSLKINQVIYVMKPSQKAIVVGKSGEMIKTIGMEARKNIADLLDKKVHLYLFVKIKENWVDIPELCM
ncbi:MAG: GTPase Era [Sphingobacteriia bacterium]|nr:GTPase Era [Sphingobacteriia bacterium]